MNDPGPFFEIERVENLFETLERVALQVGSGRPEGSRSEQWGAIVILARSALEEALWRLHQDKCALHSCEYSKVKFDSAQYKLFLEKHGGCAASIPVELHLALREKCVPNRGGGTGEIVDAPLYANELLRLLDGLNHIRNGFDHHDTGKVSRVPTEAEGLFWVASNSPTGFSWSVQKPHAFSVLRFCRLMYRHAVLSWHGIESALVSRSAPPTLLSEHPSLPIQEPLHIVNLLSDDLSRHKRREALDRIPLLQESIVHFEASELDNETLFQGVQKSACESVRGRMPACLNEAVSYTHLTLPTTPYV